MSKNKDDIENRWKQISSEVGDMMEFIKRYPTTTSTMWTSTTSISIETAATYNELMIGFKKLIVDYINKYAYRRFSDIVKGIENLIDPSDILKVIYKSACDKSSIHMLDKFDEYLKKSYLYNEYSINAKAENLKVFEIYRKSVELTKFEYEYTFLTNQMIRNYIINEYCVIKNIDQQEYFKPLISEKVWIGGRDFVPIEYKEYINELSCDSSSHLIEKFIQLNYYNNQYDDCWEYKIIWEDHTPQILSYDDITYHENYSYGRWVLSHPMTLDENNNYFVDEYVYAMLNILNTFLIDPISKIVLEYLNIYPAKLLFLKGEK